MRDVPRRTTADTAARPTGMLNIRQPPFDFISDWSASSSSSRSAVPEIEQFAAGQFSEASAVRHPARIWGCESCRPRASAGSAAGPNRISDCWTLKSGTWLNRNTKSSAALTASSPICPSAVIADCTAKKSAVPSWTGLASRPRKAGTAFFASGPIRPIASAAAARTRGTGSCRRAINSGRTTRSSGPILERQAFAVTQAVGISSGSSTGSRSARSQSWTASLRIRPSCLPATAGVTSRRQAAKARTAPIPTRSESLITLLLAGSYPRARAHKDADASRCCRVPRNSPDSERVVRQSLFDRYWVACQRLDVGMSAAKHACPLKPVGMAPDNCR